MRLAAIDLGTNSFHLVIADTKPDGTFTVIESEKEMVRLGESGNDMKLLSPEAFERGITALKRFQAIISARKSDRVKAVATSALREAENRDQFLRAAKKEAGLDVEIISGYEEGRLIYLGALQAISAFDEQALVVDIGGGSAEYVVGLKGELKYVNSLKLGAIRLTRKFKLGEKPTSKQIIECRKMIAGELAGPARAIKQLKFERVIGTSGTIQSVAAMISAARDGASNPSDRLNNFMFDYHEVQAVVEKLLNASSIEQRKKIAGLDDKRADIILAGALVLQESMRLLDIENITISSYALREGVIYDEIQRHHLGAGTRPKQAKHTEHVKDVRESSVWKLAERTNFERAHSVQVARLAVDLFDKTIRLHHLRKPERDYLYFAALLHDIGYYISHSQHHKHSYYLIRHAELLGFTDEEIEIIANVARYHRKSHPKLKHEGFAQLASDEHRETVRQLSAILRIADGLDRGHLSLVEGFAVSFGRQAIKLSLEPKRAAPRDLELEIWGAERKKMLFEEVFGRSVQFIDLSKASKTSRSGVKKPIPARVKASETSRSNGKNAKATGSKKPR
jgi:exopolyphosphatase / guanosine-5'-triphosphate,3'-diphosphate pyrophosphatase